MSLSFSSATESTITVNASYTGVADSAKFYADGAFNGSRSLDGTNTTHSFSYTYTGLNSSQTYSLTVHFYNGATDLGSNTITASTTAPPAPSPVTSVVGSSSGTEPATLSFSWNASSPVTSYSWTLRKNGGTISSGSTSSTSIGFTNMSAGSYSLGVTPFNGVTAGSGTSSADVIVSPPRPNNFSWTGGNKVSGNTIVVLASDWNSLVNRVNQFRLYKLLNTTTMNTVSSGTTISAFLYNQVAGAINEMNPPGGQVSFVSSGQTITAFAINRLNACLNSIP
jgi:hypothetical protein